MKSLFRTLICLCLLSPVMVQAQEVKNEDIQVFPAVVKTAEWANFKYMDVFNKAKSGDPRSIIQFLEFNSVVDGTEGLQHATTCLEMLPLLIDDLVGSGISGMKPKMKSLLLSRLQLAQGRTKKEALLKPIQEWAPFTWKALNGERVTCTSCMHMNGGMTQLKPAGMDVKPGAEKSAPAATDTETGKQ
jgi:hypothetical protein